MVANSLLAYASVNHLHYHFMCVAEPVLAVRVVRKIVEHFLDTIHVYTHVLVDTHVDVGF